MNPQKKLKLLLASLKDRQITKFFQTFTSSYPDQFKKTIRQISFNCFESVCEFKNKVVSGYGKNSQESFINSVRTLVQLLADDCKLHNVMRECLRIVQQGVGVGGGAGVGGATGAVGMGMGGCDSQKKLGGVGGMGVDRERETMGGLKNITVNCNVKHPVDKKTTLKQEIFEYLNLDNLKISNPNTTHKTKHHDKYLSQTNNDEQQVSVEEVLKKNRQLEEKIARAKEENVRLKYQIKQNQSQGQTQGQGQSQNQGQIQIQNQNVNQAQIHNQKEGRQFQEGDNARYEGSGIGAKTRQSYQPLKTRTNDYLNISQDTKILEKSKLRSVSVQASQTQKYLMPKATNQKKIAVPKLNLQILPNYHGKSNKSLNQSLMEVYEKTHAK